MKMIVAVTRDWGIGLQGDMLHSLPEDMAFFRQMTRGAALVMGRATLDSFPGGRPLKGRPNLVFTRDAAFAREGVTVLHDIADLRAALADWPGEVFVIGGGQIYRWLAPYCEVAYVTKMELTLPADSFFVDLDNEPGWQLAEQGAQQSSARDGTRYRFCTYRNSAVQPLP